MRLKCRRCIDRMSDKITTLDNRNNDVATGLDSFQSEDGFEAKVKRKGSTKRQSYIQHKSVRFKNDLIRAQSRGTSNGQSVEGGGCRWRTMMLLLWYSWVETCVLFYRSVALPLRLLSHCTMLVVILSLSCWYLLSHSPCIPQTKGSSIYVKDAESIERVLCMS